jgi:hypothetical protein
VLPEGRDPEQLPARGLVANHETSRYQALEQGSHVHRVEGEDLGLDAQRAVLETAADVGEAP